MLWQPHFISSQTARAAESITGLHTGAVTWTAVPRSTERSNGMRWWAEKGLYPITSDKSIVCLPEAVSEPTQPHMTKGKTHGEGREVIYQRPRNSAAEPSISSHSLAALSKRHPLAPPRGMEYLGWIHGHPPPAHGCGPSASPSTRVR